MTLPLIEQSPPLPHASGLIDLEETFLPLGRMRQITRVVDVDGDMIRGEMRLGADHWVWPEHFPGDPIFPGTLMIEAAGQLVALWAWAQGSRGRPRLVRTGAEFHSPVHPDVVTLVLSATVRRKRSLSFGIVQVASGAIAVATIEATLAVLPAQVTLPTKTV
jgi:3-hydroxymyristoyl/3-hydroxydecanoyl-(acyl carrier protein) dehydratase